MIFFIFIFSVLGFDYILVNEKLDAC